MRIRTAIEHEARIAIIGGGWIGLEIAAAARTWGCEVIVIERGRRPLERVLGPVVAQRFLDLHREHAATILTGASVAAVEAGERVATRLAHRRHHHRGRPARRGDRRRPQRRAWRPPASSRPPVASTTDEFLRTRLPGVFAAGDVAELVPPSLRRADQDRALGQRRRAGQARRRQHGGARHAVRPDPVLLHRPVRPRHGVRRARPSRHTDRAGRQRRSGLRRLRRLLDPPGPGPGRHARELVGRDGRDPRRRRGRCSRSTQDR